MLPQPNRIISRILDYFWIVEFCPREGLRGGDVCQGEGGWRKAKF